MGLPTLPVATEKSDPVHRPYATATIVEAISITKIHSLELLLAEIVESFLPPSLLHLIHSILIYILHHGFQEASKLTTGGGNNNNNIFRIVLLCLPEMVVWVFDDGVDFGVQWTIFITVDMTLEQQRHEQPQHQQSFTDLFNHGQNLSENNKLTSFALLPSTEKESRLHEFPPSACHEVWKSHSRIQGYRQGTAQIQGQDDSHFIQLPSLAQVRD